LNLRSLKEKRMSLLNINKLLDKITENWVAKAVSLGLAIILFMFHRMTSLETRFFTVPLTVETASDFIPANPQTRLIKISLRGDAATIKSVHDQDFEAYIDLQKYETEGWYHAPVKIRRNGSALGIEPVEITVDPAEVQILIDRKSIEIIPLGEIQ